MSLSEFDFSGKRVRRNGKVLSKSALMFLIGQLCSWSVYSIFDDFVYEDYASELNKLLS